MQPHAQYTFYWPDGASRDAAAWLLVDPACDGHDHRVQKRQERDRRRDLRFRRCGWYVARIDPGEATDRWPVAVTHDLTRLVQQYHKTVLTASRAGRAAHAHAPAR
jgi:hypothetical protein